MSGYHQAGEKRSDSAYIFRTVAVGFADSLYQNMIGSGVSMAMPAHFGLRNWKYRIAIN